MRLIYTLLLVAVTAVWGWTFVVVQNAIAIYGVIPFLAMRFVLAGAALTPLYATRLTRKSLLVGGAIGVVLAAAYLFQTLGLLSTTPTNSGMITGLFVYYLAPTSRGRSFWPSSSAWSGWCCSPGAGPMARTGEICSRCCARRRSGCTLRYSRTTRPPTTQAR